MFTLLRPIALLGAAASIACATTGSGPRTSAAAAVSPTAGLHTDRTTIMAEDLQSLDVSNLFDAIQRLHPEWLNPRNASSLGRRAGLTNDGINDIQVYVNTQRAGTTDLLKTMALGSATAIRFFSASESQARFGTGNLQGVIQVLTSQ